MKIARNYTIDLENVTKLREVENASELINNLLTDYFKDNTIDNIEALDDDLELLIKKKEQAILDKENESRIKKIKLHEKVKKWFKNQKERPHILKIQDFLEANKIKKEYDLLEYLKKWEEIHDKN